MTLLLVLADSEVAEVMAAADATFGVRIRLSAAHVLRSDTVGRHTAGFARGVVLELIGSSPVGAGGSCLGRLAHGRVQYDGVWVSQLRLPGRLIGTIRLELSFANQTQLVLGGSELACGFTGEVNFQESMAC